MFGAVCLALGLLLELPARADGPATLRLGESDLVVLTEAAATMSPEERVREASRVLGEAVQAAELQSVSVRLEGERGFIVVGEAPALELTRQDAESAGESSLETYANAVAARVRQALAAEHQRGRIAQTVFSVSLVVFFALIALYLNRQIAEFGERVRGWLSSLGDRRLAVSVRSIELASPAMTRSAALVLVGLISWVVRFGLFYAWLVSVLSLFDATRGYTERLTGFVLAPFSALMGRAATALPLLVVGLAAGIALLLLLRFVSLFFAAVARRETALGWLPAEWAPAASVLLRVAAVLGALMFAAPVVTGSSDGPLVRVGTVGLIAVGLAASPVLASSLVGALFLFGGRLQVGESVHIRSYWGRVSAIDLVALRLEVDGVEVVLPHLVLLTASVERLGVHPRLRVGVTVRADAPVGQVIRLLTEAASHVGREVAVRLAAATRHELHYEVSATCGELGERSRLLQHCVEAIQGVGLAPLSDSLPPRLT